MSTPTSAITPNPQLTSIPMRWFRINSGAFLIKDEVSNLVIDPNDPDVIYVWHRKFRDLKNHQWWNDSGTHPDPTVAACELVATFISPIISVKSGPN
jgi:hypothetical protein